MKVCQMVIMEGVDHFEHFSLEWLLISGQGKSIIGASGNKTSATFAGEC